MKLIDADALTAWFSCHDIDEDVSVEYVAEIIKELPEAVVRCNECRYQNKGSNEVDAWNLCAFMTGTYIPISDDDFCNHGKRRTDI